MHTLSPRNRGPPKVYAALFPTPLISMTFFLLLQRRTLFMPEQLADLLTVREVAIRLRVDDTTVRRWIKNGSLDAITLPHRGARAAYRVRRVTLDTLLTPSALGQN